MKTSTSERKLKIQWKTCMQLDDLHFTDHIALLSHIHQQTQMKTMSVATVSASVGFNIHKKKSNMLKYNTQNTNKHNHT
ncbi:unnamed protein product [Schistosoma margrebowiei]|uniref:Uncharacterized protein n=1 Tax=Schistosoma margrebowiei TaxID=48269 RepID=A0A183LAN7_9TREM|nr:unnamed protein product [Schistosoma margrebowiei]